MKIGKYLIEETRTIRIMDGTVCMLTLSVPLDFKITDKWVEEQLKDPIKTKCENWLKKHNFFMDENGRWSYDQDKKISLQLPTIFIDLKESKLRVSFGNLKNITSLMLPMPNIGYCSLEEFPRSLNKNCLVTINFNSYKRKRSATIVYSCEIYKEFIKDDKDLKGLEIEYFTKILKNTESITHDIKKKSNEFLKEYEEVLNKNKNFDILKESLIAVNKFNL